MACNYIYSVYFYIGFMSVFIVGLASKSIYSIQTHPWSNTGVWLYLHKGLRFNTSSAWEELNVMSAVTTFTFMTVKPQRADNGSSRNQFSGKYIPEVSVSDILLEKQCEMNVRQCELLNWCVFSHGRTQQVGYTAIGTCTVQYVA